MVNSQGPLRDRLADRPVLPLSFTARTADKSLSNTAVLLVGWSIRESTGSAVATVELEGNQGTGDPHVGEIQLASGASETKFLGDEGVLCEGGLNLHVIAGSVSGCVYARV